MRKIRPTYQELQKRLAAVEPIVEALKHQEVDAVVGQEKITYLLLREVGEELQNSNAELRAIFELPGIGMCQADAPAMRYTRVNQKLCEMMGYSPEELLTKTYISLTDPMDYQRDMNELSQVLRGKANSWSIEKRCICKDGHVIWVSVNGTALRNDNGQVVRVVVMMSDITTRKQTESHIVKAKPTRGKKVTVSRHRESSSTKSSVKARIKRR